MVLTLNKNGDLVEVTLETQVLQKVENSDNPMLVPAPCEGLLAKVVDWEQYENQYFMILQPVTVDDKSIGAPIRAMATPPPVNIADINSQAVFFFYREIIIQNPKYKSVHAIWTPNGSYRSGVCEFKVAPAKRT